MDRLETFMKAMDIVEEFPKTLESVEAVRKEVLRWGYEAFYYQMDNARRPRGIPPVRYAFQMYKETCLRFEQALTAEDGLWEVFAMPLGDADPYDLSVPYAVGTTLQTCFHGRLEKIYYNREPCNYAFKVWDFGYPFARCYLEHPQRFCNELELLLREVVHPCLPKLKGFCYQRVLALVYEECPTTFLSHKLNQCANFAWNDRMKVVVQLADLFAWFHDNLYILGAVRPYGIMIEEDFRIKVFDFGYLAPLWHEDEPQVFHACFYPDAPEALFSKDDYSYYRTLKADIFIFGLLLLSLITTESFEELSSTSWIAEHESKNSMVDTSFLQENDELAQDITKLVVECMHTIPATRPTMKELCTRLVNLAKNLTEKELDYFAPWSKKWRVN